MQKKTLNLNIKYCAINTALSIGATSIAWIPILLANSGVNSALEASAPPRQSGLESLKLNTARSLYFELPLRNIIQNDPNCFQYSKTLIYEPKPNSNCVQNNLEHKINVSFGKYGNRENNNQKGDGNSSPIKSILIGDSMAMGWGVPNNKTISAYLTKEGHNTLNLAVSSYGTYRELERLQIWAENNPKQYLNVQNIIIQYCDNDYEENNQFKKGYMPLENSRYLAPEYNKPQKNIYHLKFNQPLNALFSENPAAIAQSIKIIWKKSLGKAKQILRQILINSPASLPLAKAGVINHREKSHSELFWLAVKHNSRVLEGKNVIVFTANSRGAKNHETTLDLYRGLPDFQKEHSSINVKILHMKTLNNLKEKAYFRIDDHLNSLGHEAISKEIFLHLKDNV